MCKEKRYALVKLDCHKETRCISQNEVYVRKTHLFLVFEKEFFLLLNSDYCLHLCACVRACACACVCVCVCKGKQNCVETEDPNLKDKLRYLHLSLIHI